MFNMRIRFTHCTSIVYGIPSQNVIPVQYNKQIKKMYCCSIVSAHRRILGMASVVCV